MNTYITERVSQSRIPACLTEINHSTSHDRVLQQTFRPGADHEASQGLPGGDLRFLSQGTVEKLRPPVSDLKEYFDESQLTLLLDGVDHSANTSSSGSSPKHPPPHPALSRVHTILQDARTAGNWSLPRIRERDPGYFKEFKDVVSRPYVIRGYSRELGDHVLNREHAATKREMFSETRSDRCMQEMMGSTGPRQDPNMDRIRTNSFSSLPGHSLGTASVRTRTQSSADLSGNRSVHINTAEIFQHLINSAATLDLIPSAVTILAKAVSGTAGSGSGDFPAVSCLVRGNRPSVYPVRPGDGDRGGNNPSERAGGG
ncbi:hypothetical protein Bbelb_090740 [Branchiostoma belcheri]|nr:hypothetical protein Bbelb_090740 [Branchiostoma belcheri]